MSRIDKINHQIQRVVSQIIQEEVDNPKLGMVSIMRVSTSQDLHYCKVFFSVFPDEKIHEALEALTSMKGFIRKKLGLNLRMKFLPELEFISDDSIKYSIDIARKIDEVKNECNEGSSGNTEE